jgi:hypothetical protein
MEQKFRGVMPFEIVINTRQPRAVTQYKWLKKTYQLQQALEQHPEIARTTSVVDVIQWGRQALSGGAPAAYQFPIRDEFDFLQLYAQNSQQQDTALAERKGSSPNSLLQSLSDSTGAQIRITGYVEDVGSLAMPSLLFRIQTDIDSVFSIQRVAALQIGQDTLPAPQNPETAVETIITGTTRIFLKANQYLLDNLFWSLIAVFLIIGLQMFALFNSWRIMLISMVPNLIPLVITAGIMGYFGIPLKPSTALIYEMAFGIAIDNSIHYLAIYRIFRRQGKEVPEAVSLATRHTGMGIIYTSVVLFMGFIIFVPSQFGSTQSLGILTSVTLFIAMFSNLLLMPALLIRFDRRGRLEGKAMIDEEEADATEAGNPETGNPEVGPYPSSPQPSV